MSTIMTRGGAEFWWKEKLPRNVIHMYNNHPGEKWKAYTWEEEFAKRKQRQDWNINDKRRSQRTIPCFIWVFKNDTFFFGGWWIYIKTLKHEYGINFRNEYDERIIQMAMAMFPCGVLPIVENFSQWAKQFADQYPHAGFKRKKNQGLKLCHCTVDENGDLVNVHF